MDLISCDNCGTVVDGNKVTFIPVDELSEEQMETHAEWYEREYVSCVPCPVCNEKIRENA